MRSRTLTLVLLGVLLALIQRLPTSANAEQNGSSLLLVFDGDIWDWTGPDSSLENLTHSGGVIVADLSPDGMQVVYAEVPDLVKQAYEAHEWAGLIPHDVRVLNRMTGTSTLIAGQPTNISVMENGLVSPDIERTFPVWSPDGTMLAWTELNNDPKPGHVLVIYSLDKNQVVLTQEIALIELPTQVQWGAAGIAVQNLANSDVVYQIVDVEGHIVDSTLSPAYDINTYHWVHDGKKDYLYLPDSGTHPGGQFFDPVSGRLTAPSDTFEMYALSAPEGASLMSSLPPFGDIMLRLADIQIAFPGRSPITLSDADERFTQELQYPYPSYPAAISPDGQSVAYAHDRTVTIAQADQQIETGIALPSNTRVQLLWGASGWRVPHGE